jgi:hypothetical protein
LASAFASLPSVSALTNDTRVSAFPFPFSFSVVALPFMSDDATPIPEIRSKTEMSASDASANISAGTVGAEQAESSSFHFLTTASNFCSTCDSSSHPDISCGVRRADQARVEPTGAE